MGCKNKDNDNSKQSSLSLFFVFLLQEPIGDVLYIPQAFIKMMTKKMMIR